MKDTLKKIKFYTDQLIDHPWDHPNPDTLSELQGRISGHLAYVGSMKAKARHDLDVAQCAHKDAEAVHFLEMRKKGKTVEESKMLARIECSEAYMLYLGAKKYHDELDSILNSSDRLIVACQVAMKNLRKEQTR